MSVRVALPCRRGAYIVNFGTGGVAQVIELLLCKCKVLSSNPNPPPKKPRNIVNFDDLTGN
jgi:hypothetical protein